MKKLAERLTIGVVSLMSQLALADNAMQSTLPDPTPAPVQHDSAQSLTRHSRQLARDRIDQEGIQALHEIKVKPVVEALSAVQETHTALDDLDKGNTVQARLALVRALGKTDLVLSSHPGTALVPISAEVHIVDIDADDATIKRISNQIKELVSKNQLQAARPLVRSLASEIDVYAVNLPLVTYPPAIRVAARLLDEGKPDEAKKQLQTALERLVITERAIPLPVVRAEALVDEVNHQITAKKVDKAEATQLLTDADQQLDLAERLGYGTRTHDFKDLRASIDKVKKSIGQEKESSGALAKLRSDLESIKNKFSRAPASL